MYPDQGCNNEVYVEGDYFKMESLGPLQRLAPGEAVDPVEHWEIFTDVNVGTDEDSLAAAVHPLLDA